MKNLSPQSTNASTISLKKISNDEIWIISINRPEVRNCVDRPTASLLSKHFKAFDHDPLAKVAILTGSGGNFCAGADLKAVASGDNTRANAIERQGDGPMGPTRLQLSKPVIAAVSGYCVAGGLELALWCDLRVADESAIFGVFCRRFGVPLIDGGTVRLPRLIGQSQALDLILTGREVKADEAFRLGLANRLTEEDALTEAERLAHSLCQLPQTCMRNDRASVYNQWGLPEAKAIADEFEYGISTLSSGETLAGAQSFTEGKGRHGGKRES